MTSTHDLPTVAGWWHGTDIAVREQYGRLGEGVKAADQEAERTRDREALWQRFVAEGVARGSAPSPETTKPVVDAALSFVARTRSPLCLIPLEDFLGQEEQPNLPGTVDEHPNWRRRTPTTTDDLLKADATAARIAAAAAERPRK
jgi:4-alpha-glucanotransferase